MSNKQITYIMTRKESKALAKRYSQLKPTRAKLQNRNLHQWVAKRYRQVEPLIVWLRPHSHLTITKQLGENIGSSWPSGEILGSSWAKIWAWSNSSQFDPTRANSSQVGGQTIPNSIEVVNLAHVGLSWEYRLARAQKRILQQMINNYRA